VRSSGGGHATPHQSYEPVACGLEQQAWRWNNGISQDESGGRSLTSQVCVMVHKPEDFKLRRPGENGRPVSIFRGQDGLLLWLRGLCQPATGALPVGMMTRVLSAVGMMTHEQRCACFSRLRWRTCCR
jgi:hypothetical protein